MKRWQSGSNWTRRQFLAASLSLATIRHARVRGAEAGAQPKLRAAIIGDTGHGDYGHEHELIFDGRENIQIVAVADPDTEGRAKAAGRAHALRSYADYRQMLEQERPQLVCVAPRWTDQHYAMAQAALGEGAHVYLEKPMTQTLAEADELLALARKSGLKIAVAHQMRLAPNILFLKQRLAEGLLGELLEIRAHGKQDHRAGGEDLIVLGVHLFDLMRFFAGQPLWCSARILQKEHEITAQDAHPATENVGPVAGDDIVSQFAFPKGVYGTFQSRARNREAAGPWGLELIGSQGTIKILMEMIPRIYRPASGAWTAEGSGSQWRLWEEDPTLELAELERSVGRANGRVVDDWLQAIKQDREPVCSGEAAMKALEMAMAVFTAGLTRQRAELSLKNRQHPLTAG